MKIDIFKKVNFKRNRMISKNLFKFLRGLKVSLFMRLGKKILRKFCGVQKYWPINVGISFLFSFSNNLEYDFTTHIHV